MAFTFADHALITPAQLSKFIWGVDDATTGLPVANTLTTQQIFSIELIVNSISKQIMRFCSSDIKAQNYTEVWDGAGSDELIPRMWPINSVASVKISSNGDWSASTALATELISFNEYSISFRSYRTPVGRGMLQLIYNAGYEEVPDDIVLATLLQFQWLYKKIGKGDSMVGIGNTSKSIAGGSESQTKDASITTQGLIGEVIGLLKPYERFEAPSSVMFTRMR